ncbi:hypothetical protein A1D22_06025 [Pasteurellaceae bacterium LFhippo2]|nr:hypothetical protein [Pasteurellaceae bacterium LFhippo2]
MIIEIPTTKQVNVQYLKISVPVRYDDEDMPYNFPLRQDDIWEATINLDTNKIENWPQGQSGSFCMKVCDEGSYSLLDENKETIAEIVEYYVPNNVVPGEYGDYISMQIDETGEVLNMPSDVDFDEFFKRDED